MSDELNEYDDLISQQDKIKEDALRSSMLGAVSKNRAEQPKIFDLSKKSNLPVGVVERNIQQVQQKVDYEANEYDGMLEKYPALAEYLGDPNRAALVYDDVSALTHVSDYLRSGGAGIVSIGGAAKGVADLSKAIGSKMTSLLPDVIEKPFREWEAEASAFISPVNPLEIARRGGQSFNNLAEMMRPPVERRSFGTDVLEH